ncbi:MAG TPA: S-adenosylmethionine decarboxylase [Thermoanaerobaculia bacterium]|nr:S-adenosylmethionine decarboxylase [Thermoanaerobaculia bacterium]
MIGSEWLVDAAGCRPGALASVAALRSLFERVTLELDLHPVHEPRFHLFPPPGGVTGFVILSESHLACHTYPEHGIITLNLYCCRPRPEWPWRERLGEILGASEVVVRAFARSVEQTVSEEEVASWR